MVQRVGTTNPSHQVHEFDLGVEHQEVGSLSYADDSDSDVVSMSCSVASKAVDSISGSSSDVSPSTDAESDDSSSDESNSPSESSSVSVSEEPIPNADSAPENLLSKNANLGDSREGEVPLGNEEKTNGAQDGDGGEDGKGKNENNDGEDRLESLKDKATKVGIGAVVAVGIAMKLKKKLAKAVRVIEKFNDDIQDGKIWHFISSNSSQPAATTTLSAAQTQVAQAMAVQAASNLASTAANVSTATAGAAGSAGAAGAGSSSTAGISVGVGVTTGMVAAAAAAASVYSGENVHVCNVDPEIYRGKIFLRLGNLDRKLTTGESQSLITNFDRVYNEIIGGCDDAFERFGVDIDMTDERLGNFQSGIPYLDTILEGNVRCYGCNPSTPFFGERVQVDIDVTKNNAPSSRRLTNDQLAKVFGTIGELMDEIFPEEQVKLAKAAEIPPEDIDIEKSPGLDINFGELTLSPSQSPTNFPSVFPSFEPTTNPSTYPSIYPSSTPSISPSVLPSMNPTAAPVHVCNADPEVYNGNIFLRLGHLNRSLSATEQTVLSSKVGDTFNDVTGGCNDVYERFGTDVKVSADVVGEMDNGISYVDVVLIGKVACYGCNDTEPFFGVRIDSDVDDADNMNPDEMSLSTNVTAIEILRERSREKFVEMLSSLSFAMDEIFPGLNVELVYGSENGVANEISETGILLVDLTHAPSTNPSDSPSLSPSHEPSYLPSVIPSGKPSSVPSASPSDIPSLIPSYHPTSIPSVSPSVSPSTSPSVSPSFLPSMYPSHQPSNLPSIAPPCDAELLRVIDVSDGGSCSRQYDGIPILVDKHLKDDDCISFKFNQSLFTSSVLEYVFIEFLDCDRPDPNSKRCMKKTSIKPYETVGPNSVKCTDGFAFVKVFAQDKDAFTSSDIVNNLPGACNAPKGIGESRCEWEFKIPCTC